MGVNRLTLLAQIRQEVGERLEDGRVQGRMTFCIEDGARLGPEAREPAGYRHDTHFHPRAFIFDPVTQFEFRPDGELLHFAVGGLLWREEADGPRYCLFRRRMHPTGYYTLPAGHLELGETPDLTLRREVYEETGLGVLSAELLFEGELPDDCRRGADYHYWHAYLCPCIGEPALCNESDIVGWYTRAEILRDLPLTYPTGVICERLFGEWPARVRGR